ncbi:hypothetical protein [Archangium lipolyticum]|uniref:hypothetical protein n=1 Tax=Archangium lipolyticum TaxID=2970465 RepID=UPI00214A4635|nr:hypothetical protein [Archangium lipolyticum]
MNAITWQAAWLRHHFKWVRVLVGYALTDIPERVLEIYGIPTNDLERAQRILEKLRAQDEYQELKACCDEGREGDEVDGVLLPAMQYKTFLKDFMEEHMKQLGLENSRRQLQREREANRMQLARFDKLQADLDNTRKRLAGARDRLSGPQGTSAVADADASSAARQEVSRLEKEVRSFEELIASLPTRSILNDREKTFLRRLSDVEKDLKKSKEDLNRQLDAIRVPDYFLNVTIKLSHDALPAYIQEMTMLLEEFAWDFMAAGEKLPLPADVVARVPTGHEIMHIWRFGDANDLYRQMVGLRESRRYSAVRRLLTDTERQMLMCDWEAISKPKAKKKKKNPVPSR